MSLPTMPSGGRLFDCWKSTTAASVVAPKVPSGRPVANPRAASPFWSSVTTAPRSPRFSDVPAGRATRNAALGVVEVVVVVVVVERA